MKRKKWKTILICLALALCPLQACALEARNIFSDVTDTLSQRMNEWMKMAAVHNAQDLQIELTLDRDTLRPNESALVQVTMTNPRLRESIVSFQMNLSHGSYLTCTEGEKKEEITLPAATIEADGTILPSQTQRTFRVAMLPASAQAEGLIQSTAAATLQEGSRWYQSAGTLTLCTPQISAVLRATNDTLAPQEGFEYEVALTNSGGAQGTADVTLTLPEGVTYAPRLRETVSAGEAAPEDGAVPERPVLADANARETELIVEGRRIACTLDVPPAQYEDGKMTAPAQTLLRIPVRVDAAALEQTPSAVRVLECEATLNGQALQKERVTVRGPIIACRLVPSLRDMEMGGVLHYTCEVTNSGYAPADVQVTFQVPEGMRFARFVTRGLQNKVAGDMLSWVVHLDAAEFDSAGKPRPARAEITYQVRADELEDGLHTLIVPATAVYQIGEGGKASATQVALTNVHRPTVMGFSGEEWFLLFWAGVILLLTVVVLMVMLRRDEEKGR